MYWLTFKKLFGNIQQNTIYEQGKMIRGTVLDSPLKGKMTETCVVEDAMNIVWATPRIG